MALHFKMVNTEEEWDPRPGRETFQMEKRKRRAFIESYVMDMPREECDAEQRRHRMKEKKKESIRLKKEAGKEIIKKKKREVPPIRQQWSYLDREKRIQVMAMKKDVHSKLNQVQMKQDKLNDALQSVQEFLDKSPNFTSTKNRTKAKDLQQHLLRASESQEVYLRGLLDKVRQIREYEQKSTFQNLRNNRCLLMKLLYFQAQTLPLWVSTVKEPYAPVGVGACAVDEMKPLEVGEFCAAYYDETWILVEVLHVHPSGKYDLKDVDCKEKNEPKVVDTPHVQLSRKEHLDRLLEMRNDEGDCFDEWKKNVAAACTIPEVQVEPLPRIDCYQYPPFEDDEPPKRGGTTFSVFRKRLIALPKYRADPQKDSHALFPPEAIVLALYPQTTCFYKGVIIKQPQTAIDDYLISFEDKVYPSGWSPPSRVPQRYVVTYKEIKSHKKKLNIFDEP